MNRELEKQKEMTNKIFGYYSSYKEGQCTYDRALELGSKVLNEYAQSQTTELQKEIETLKIQIKSAEENEELLRNRKNGHIKILKEEIDRLKAENEWISVKDKLPTTIEDYLVTDGAACMVSKFDTSTNNWCFWTINWWESNEVTHWRPLPQPPKQ